jgi:ubiquinone/menaquinone biosynthesis C-methylase UbiE
MNKKSITEVTYGYLAKEYYDELLHPTCANFRIASKELINDFIKTSNIRKNNVLEIGAGKSVLIEVLEELNFSIENLIISDKEKNMLHHTESMNKNKSYSLIETDAQSTNFPDDTFDLIVSSLGDPYNTEKLWSEISRILLPGGLCIFTTPSYEWSNTFRKSPNVHKYAEFITLLKEKVYVPSFIYDFGEQKQLIEKFNLSIQTSRAINLSQLSTTNISTKLLINNESELPIVTGYLVRKN